jgi:putative ABC transport system ATP-binding protein
MSETTTQALLRTDQLTRQVGNKVIVNHISLEVHPGDLVAIIGKSGAGKSSFVRLINRLDEPTSGNVYLNGQDYHQLPPRELRRRVGMVMQSAYLFPGTVADNLRFGPRQRGEELATTEIDGLLEQVGLKGYSSRNVAYLSGGEAQRVSLARTLANHPEILLLDEPTSALDEQAEHEVENLLSEIIHTQHLTALMITHDMGQAERIANRAILIDAGKLVTDGTVQEVLHAATALQ